MEHLGGGEDVGKGVYVVLKVFFWMGQGLWDAFIGGEVDDGGGLELSEDICHCTAVAAVLFVILYAGDNVFPDVDVDAYEFSATIVQFPGKMGSNIAAGAGDEDHFMLALLYAILFPSALWFKSRTESATSS